MINKKNMVIAAFAAILIGNGVSLADNSNDLLRMDIKKSGASDTVDVTFYTTGGATDSVVTRKSDNKYVVLLPNVAGSQSVAPSLGGVKDLVSDVSVKNVDDGIGGYTKVTFSTTKPVKFQTYTKKTAPLTQAQQDYKNLIAANSKFDPDKKMQNFKGTNTTTSSAKLSAQTKTTTSAPKAAAAKTSVKDSKTAATTPQKTVQKPSSAAQKTVNNAQKPSVSKQVPQKSSPKKAEVKPQQQKSVQPVAAPVTASKTSPAANSANSNVTDNVPKMQFDKNGNRTMDLEPKVNHNVEKSTVVPKIDNTKVDEKTDTASKSVNNNTHKEKKGLPIFPIAGALSALGILLLSGIIGKLTHSASKNSSKLRESFGAFDINQSKKRGSEYKNLMEDKSLSWQEKYKRYTQKTEEFNKDSSVSSDYSYVTNMGATQSAISSEEIQPTQIQAVVSQMEHALSQTPSLNMDIKEKSNDVITDENAVTEKMNSVKLKSFAKSMSLREANRSILKTTSPTVSKTSAKEGRFVKLRNSALSMSRRNSLSSRVNISDLARTNSIYDKISKGENMTETKTSTSGIQPVRQTVSGNNRYASPINTRKAYSTSSINEYLDLVGNENGASSLEVLSRPMASMNHSNASNPVSPVPVRNHGKDKLSKTSESVSSSDDKLAVRDKYSIDNDKSIYLVDLNGETSIVAEVNGEVTVIKKFDKIINKPLQVRLDYGNVYIVKLGGYKSLVDVSETKVGTLLEI